MLNDIGHVDFYPAGGRHQPGCTDICLGDEICSEVNINDLIKGGCSHARSHEFWIESVTAAPWDNLEFLAWRSESWDDFQAGDMCTHVKDYAVMGAWADPKT